MPKSAKNTPVFIQALTNPSVYSHPVSSPITILETHISWVILTGPYAYKIKKPVDLGFLDFSTLPLRHQACLDELRLNRRLAPTLYLEVIPITGSPHAPQFHGKGEPFEFTVKMRQFPLDATLDQALPKGKIQPRHIDQLAKNLANFHMALPPSPETLEFGSPEGIAKVVNDVVTRFTLETLSPTDCETLQVLQQWIRHEHARGSHIFADRKQQGFIRECHGDLHLANVVLLDDRPTPFDGIEFSESLRWIDVMSDTAFLAMDFQARGWKEFSWQFLNAYLEHTGDYEGLAVFRFYEVYRALVRGKVANIRLHQTPPEDPSRATLQEECHRYLSLATQLAHPPSPSLLIMHGLSGSGKTTIAQSMLERIGAIRLRSDVERKRMFGIPLNAPSSQKVKDAMYAAKTTNVLYHQLRDTAKKLLCYGYHVIVDAAFLTRQYRDLFRQLAEDQHVPFLILDVHAALDTMRERVTKRAEQESDASEADLTVLHQQLERQEELGEDEQELTIAVNSEEPFDPTLVLHHLRMGNEREDQRK